MNQILKVLTFLFIMILLFAPVSGAAAQEGDTDPGFGEDEYTFEYLGYEDEVLMGPYDFMRVRFNLPANWKLTSGSSIQLHLKNVYPVVENDSILDVSNTIGVRLDLEFNNQVIDSILLDWVGESTVTFNIPQTAIETSSDEQSFSIYMDAGVDCRGYYETSVIVYADSYFNLIHRTVQPDLDLTTIPSPIFRANSLVPHGVDEAAAITSTYIVLPDKPAAAELQAALTASAGLGRLTDDMPLNILLEKNLTPEIKAVSNLIFTGLGESFSSLEEILFPVSFESGSFALDGIQPDDGILQEAYSPWNDERVVLLISGQNEAGIVKAAQAFSTGDIRTHESTAVAVVSEVSGGQYAESVEVDRTLADLGYGNVQLNSSIFSEKGYLGVEFPIPAGQVTDNTAYLDVFYANSPLLNYEESGITVFLNGTSIGGIVYEEEAGDSLVHRQIRIPGHLLVPGTNSLLFQSDNIPRSFCSEPSGLNTWTVIYDQTLLHIPLEVAVGEVESLLMLYSYYEGLTVSPTLSNVGFVIAPDSPASLFAASQIAYELGDQMLGGLVEIRAAYADQVPEEFREGLDLILIGAASNIPMILELNEYLPASFEEDSNLVNEAVFDVEYRLPDGISLGYLELLETPWDSTHIIVGVLGTTEAGILDAANALTIPALRRTLSGNFAVVRGEQVLSSDTRLGVGTGNLSAELVPEVSAQVVQADQSTNELNSAAHKKQQNLLLMAIGISTLAVVGVVFTVFRRTRKKS
ncbi:MAG: cellulose biosynthesis cyclic di-GMP-binding regulatory protein BcsB [Anaerolineales bacterium]|nr:cellulose biosynthesis cyclic di-GMP-binding regulatory protein BcsB [Anaerolineales bacterium]